MEYLTIKETSSKWGISPRRVQALCNTEQVEGAIRFSGVWAIPKDAQKPVDHRIKTGKYIKHKDDAATPILKWAGGKTQMLEEIQKRLPENFNQYIEPFLGGGAVFFYLQHKPSVIADSNPELINLYKEISLHCEEVISLLKNYRNEEEQFYAERAKNWLDISPIEAAARTIYLNRTCFNGLYRLNRKGMFNTPFGHYKHPTICNEEKLRAASQVLQQATIVCGDYLEVLKKYARPDDFIFLDPPYIPVSQSADFKRYTKEQFYETDHRKLASEVDRLVALGCKVMLTNSNHPLVYELYGKYKIEVVQTRRNINRKGNKRRGEDVIVTTYENG